MNIDILTGIIAGAVTMLLIFFGVVWFVVPIGRVLKVHSILEREIILKQHIETVRVVRNMGSHSPFLSDALRNLESFLHNEARKIA